MLERLVQQKDAYAHARQRHLSFWDAMIVASAIQLGRQTIWSDDLSKGQVYDTVTVASPF